MPIIDIQFVLPKGQALPEGLAQDLVDRLGRVLSVQPGHLWLRLQVLPASNYAENESAVASHDLPIFVTVMRASNPPPPCRSLRSEPHRMLISTCHRTKGIPTNS